MSVAFAPFIRSRTLTFTATSMKPLTRIYPFFDGIDISSNVTPTGSSAGAALTTDSTGSASGTFVIPDPTNTSNPKWRTGTRTFRLTSNSQNALVGDIFTSAETDYVAKGMIQQVQGTIISTREPQVTRTTLNEATSVQMSSAARIISNSTTVVGRVNTGGGGGGGAAEVKLLVEVVVIVVEELVVAADVAADKIWEAVDQEIVVVIQLLKHSI